MPGENLQKEVEEYVKDCWVDPEFFITQLNPLNSLYISRTLGFQWWKLGKELRLLWLEIRNSIKSLIGR